VVHSLSFLFFRKVLCSGAHRADKLQICAFAATKPSNVLKRSAATFCWKAACCTSYLNIFDETWPYLQKQSIGWETGRGAYLKGHLAQLDAVRKFLQTIVIISPFRSNKMGNSTKLTNSWQLWISVLIPYANEETFVTSLHSFSSIRELVVTQRSEHQNGFLWTTI